jgi:hypothetical protein
LSFFSAEVVCRGPVGNLEGWRWIGDCVTVTQTTTKRLRSLAAHCGGWSSSRSSLIGLAVRLQPLAVACPSDLDISKYYTVLLAP